MSLPILTLEHPAIPQWFREAAGRIFEQTNGRISRVNIEFEARYYYDDNSNYNLKAYPFFSYADSNNLISEDELDTIPSVRKLERRAEELWSTLPLNYDDDGVSGEYECWIEKDKFHFENVVSPYTGNADLGINAVYEDGKWTTETYAIVPLDNIVFSDVLGADNPREALNNQIDPSFLNMRELPEILEFSIIDDDFIKITFPDDGFSKWESDVDRESSSLNFRSR